MKNFCIGLLLCICFAARGMHTEHATKEYDSYMKRSIGCALCMVASVGAGVGGVCVSAGLVTGKTLVAAGVFGACFSGCVAKQCAVAASETEALPAQTDEKKAFALTGVHME